MPKFTVTILSTEPDFFDDEGAAWSTVFKRWTDVEAENEEAAITICEAENFFVDPLHGPVEYDAFKEEEI